MSTVTKIIFLFKPKKRTSHYSNRYFICMQVYRACYVYARCISNFFYGARFGNVSSHSCSLSFMTLSHQTSISLRQTKYFSQMYRAQLLLELRERLHINFNRAHRPRHRGVRDSASGSGRLRNFFGHLCCIQESVPRWMHYMYDDSIRFSACLFQTR